ncbi:MAG: hypothetical protein WBE74_26805, partial [Terracidiphilus sp.]
DYFHAIALRPIHAVLPGRKSGRNQQFSKGESGELTILLPCNRPAAGAPGVIRGSWIVIRGFPP